MFRVDGTLVDCGIDWLTFRPEGRAEGEIAWKVWSDWVELESSGTVKERLKKRSTMRSMSCSGMAVMYSRTGPCSLSISGEALSMVPQWYELSLLRAARMDIQATVSLSESLPTLAARLYDWWGSENSVKTLRMKRVLMQSPEGQTVYLGRRQSPRFLRVYDKGGQSGLASLGRCWRVELELKSKAARPAWEAWNAIEDRAGWCYSQVVAYLRTVNVQLATGVDPDVGMVRMEPSRESVGSTLEWLEKTVRPAVVRLNRDGHVKDVFRALGLTYRGE